MQILKIAKYYKNNNNTLKIYANKHEMQVGRKCNGKCLSLSVICNDQ